MFTKFVLGTCCLLIGLTAGASFAGVRTKHGHPVLLINQVVQDGVSRTTLKVGSVAWTKAGLATTSTTKPPVGIGELAKVISVNLVGTNPPAASMATLETSAKFNLDDKARTVTEALTPFMRKYGVPSAWYSFTQSVRISTDSGIKPAKLVWNFNFTQDGKVQFGDPHISSLEPGILHVKFVPGGVDDSLPSNWSFPNAGTVQYRTMDKNLVPLTAWVTINVGTAYDDPPSSATGVDPDSGLKCLIDPTTSSSCSNAVAGGVKALMDATGTITSLIEYTRKLTPVHVEDPPGSGNLVSKMSLKLDVRQASVLCGVGTYTNEGMYGFELLNKTDNYLIAKGSYTPILASSAEIATTSPVVAYSKTINLTHESANLIYSHVINPAPGSQELVEVDLIKSQLAGGTVIATTANLGESSFPLSAYTENCVRDVGGGFYLACEGARLKLVYGNYNCKVSTGLNSFQSPTPAYFTPFVASTAVVSTSGFSSTVTYDGLGTIQVLSPFTANRISPVEVAACPAGSVDQEPVTGWLWWILNRNTVKTSDYCYMDATYCENCYGSWESNQYTCPTGFSYYAAGYSCDGDNCSALHKCRKPKVGVLTW